MIKYKGLKRIFSILCVVGVFVLCAIQVQKIKPFQVQNLLPKDHPLRIEYNAYNEQYDDENKVFVLLKKERKYLSNEIYQLLSVLENEFKFYGGLSSFGNLKSAKYFTFDDQRFSLVSFLEKGDWTKRAKEKLTTDFWKNTLISDDGKSLLLTFTITKSLERKERVPLVKKIMKNIDEVIEGTGIASYYLGTEVANYWFTKEMIKNQILISPVLMLLMGIFFYFIFSSFKVVAFSYLIIILSYALTIIMIIAFEGGIGPYSSFALYFVAIVATSDLIHFFSTYRQEGSNIEQTVLLLKKPCFLTSLTTSIGFSALVINENVPVRYFGMYCTLGTFGCYLLTFYVLPRFLTLYHFKLEKVEDVSISVERIWSFIRRKRNIIIGVFAILTAIFSYESLRIEIDDNLYRKFLNSHPLSQSIDNFSDGLNFVGSVDVLIKSNGSEKINSRENIEIIKSFERDIAKLPSYAHHKSFTQLYENLNNEVKDDRTMNSLFNMLYDYGALNSFYKKINNEVRVVLFLKSLNSVTLENTINDIKELNDKYKDLEIKTSGFSSIRNYINQNVIKSFTESFLYSIVLIFCLFLFLFKSIKWALISMIPNIFPLITISGLMGLFNITMESNLVILVSITIGIAVDDTIHFVFNLKKNMDLGHNVEDSIKYSLKKTLMALVTTTSIFIFSFPTFLFADLKLFVQVGVFILISLVAALLADFLLLPSVMLSFKRTFDDNL